MLTNDARVTGAMVVLVLVGVPTSAHGAPAPSTSPALPDNDNGLVFFQAYGEIDPFDRAWRPELDALHMDVLHRMGVNVSCPMTQSPNVEQGLKHPWTRHWLQYPDTTTAPWALWLNWPTRPDSKPVLPLGCFGNPDVRPHLAQMLSRIRDVYGERMLRVNGRPVINFEKENAYTWGGPINHPMSQHFCWRCEEHFGEWLRKWYGDASPAEDTSGDGRTMSGECGARFTRWGPHLFGPMGRTALREQRFRELVQDKYGHPMLHWLWQRWISDIVWRDTYLPAIEEAGVWQLVTQHAPPRYVARQPFICETAFTFAPSDYTGDFFTRRDPRLRGLAYSCGLYQTNAVVGDPYVKDRFLAQTFGRISRLKAIYEIDFCSHSAGEFHSYQTSLCYFPGRMESLSWWAHTLRAQKALLDDMLTHAPDVAIYPGEIATFPAFSAVGHLHGALVASGYPIHYLDGDQILEGALQHYKVLLIHGERLPKPVMERIAAFRREGGHVAAFFTAMTWSIRETEPRLFESVFGAEFKRVLRTRKALQWEMEEPPFFTARDQETDVSGYPFVYRPADANHPLWTGVRAYWRRLPFRDDALVLVRPTTARPLAVVEAQPADTAPAAADEACATLSQDGRALFLGMHQGGTSTLRVRLVANFLESAGVRKPAACTGSFDDYYEEQPSMPPRAIEAYRLGNPQGNKHLLVIVNSDTEQARDVEVSLPEGPPTRQAAELRQAAPFTIDGNRLALRIPAGQVRLILLSTPEVVAQALAVQEKANRDARLFPWHCSRHFFVRRPVPEVRSWKAIYDALSPAATKIPAEPNCAIVLPNSPSEADRAFADRLAAIIEKWPLASNPLRLPIRTAKELTPEERKRLNLLLVGGPEENPCTASEFARVGLRASAPIVSYHERGWYTGDSFVAIIGTRGDRRAAFVEFLDWLRLWMDGSGRYIPERSW